MLNKLAEQQGLKEDYRTWNVINNSIIHLIKFNFRLNRKLICHPKKILQIVEYIALCMPFTLLNRNPWSFRKEICHFIEEKY